MASTLNHSPAPMRAVMELRGVIDGFAARKAAEQIAEGSGKRALIDAFARFRRAAERGCYPGALKADRQLHLAIVRVAAVEALEPAWETVANTREWFHVPARYVGSLDLKQFAERHRALVEAICAGDAAAAENAAAALAEAPWRQLGEHVGETPLLSDPLARACSYLAALASRSGSASWPGTWPTPVRGICRGCFTRKHGVNFTEYPRALRMQRPRGFSPRHHSPFDASRRWSHTSIHPVLPSTSGDATEFHRASIDAATVTVVDGPSARSRCSCRGCSSGRTRRWCCSTSSSS